MDLRTLVGHDPRRQCRAIKHPDRRRPHMIVKPLMLAVVASLLVPAAQAAIGDMLPKRSGPQFTTVNHSNSMLIDEKAAQAVWQAQLAKIGPKRLSKLYPPSKWGFLSQVEGGFTAGKVCTITASVSLMPRTSKTVAFKPEKMAVAFDAQPGATQEQCHALAKVKLEEAIASVMSSLAATK